MTDAPSRRTYETLDAIAVVGVLIIVGGGLGGLMTVHNIPDANLPIISGLLGTIVGTILGGYAAFRWTNGPTPARPTTTATTVKGDVNVTPTEKV